VGPDVGRWRPSKTPSPGELPHNDVAVARGRQAVGRVGAPGGTDGIRVRRRARRPAGPRRGTRPVAVLRRRGHDLQAQEVALTDDGGEAADAGRRAGGDAGVGAARLENSPGGNAAHRDGFFDRNIRRLGPDARKAPVARLVLRPRRLGARRETGVGAEARDPARWAAQGQAGDATVRVRPPTDARGEA
jgi:hypothetical protein